MNCLQYWDKCKYLSLDAAVALWCNVEPSELIQLNIHTSCMDSKRQLIVEALMDKRLVYKEMPVYGGWIGCDLDELIKKDRLLICKDSLRRFFEEMPINERPAFLFEESRRHDYLPDGSKIAEMNTMKALAVMTYLVSQTSDKYKNGDKPNFKQIGDKTAQVAGMVFKNDTPQFKALHKKLSEAWRIAEKDQSLW